VAFSPLGRPLLWPHLALPHQAIRLPAFPSLPRPRPSLPSACRHLPHLPSPAAAWLPSACRRSPIWPAHLPGRAVARPQVRLPPRPICASPSPPPISRHRSPVARLPAALSLPAVACRRRSPVTYLPSLRLRRAPSPASVSCLRRPPSPPATAFSSPGRRRSDLVFPFLACHPSVCRSLPPSHLSGPARLRPVCLPVDLGAFRGASFPGFVGVFWWRCVCHFTSVQLRVGLSCGVEVAYFFAGFLGAISSRGLLLLGSSPSSFLASLWSGAQPLFGCFCLRGGFGLVGWVC
jgi:hypothetical protein